MNNKKIEEMVEIVENLSMDINSIIEKSATDCILNGRPIHEAFLINISAIQAVAIRIIDGFIKDDRIDQKFDAIEEFHEGLKSALIGLIESRKSNYNGN